jgi:cytochrome P450
MHMAFTRPQLKSYADCMNPMIERTRASWPASGERMLAFNAYKQLTLDMATAIFVGADLQASDQTLDRSRRVRGR